MAIPNERTSFMAVQRKNKINGLRVCLSFLWTVTCGGCHNILTCSFMKGIALVISGPAGVGKTTLCDRLLLNHNLTLTRVITVTTRKPRDTERNGSDYIFVNRKKFLENIKCNAFLEYAEIHGNWYGSYKQSVQDKFQNNFDVLLNIDVQGASALKDLEKNGSFLCGKFHSVFIMPSSLNELKQRLIKRGQDTFENIENRMKTAEKEIKFSKSFDRIILSKTKDEDYKELNDFYLKHSKLAKN